MRRRAIFLDRDGTISEEVGFVNHVDRFRLLPRSIEAVRRVNEAGFLAILITNQSGIARGLFDESLVETVHETLKQRLRDGGARLDAAYVCPHHPSAGIGPWRRRCDCRKPSPGLLHRAAREHGLDLSSSYMIGDTVLDLETARAAGVTGVLVLTGYGKGELRFRVKQRGLGSSHVAADLLEAVEWVIRREETR
ncbi:MAG: D-glycero-alpha-D-manno-heptose-1,7-bisphosphate 7-phosphatase [Acidobacteriota bacterium]